jgi:PPOX class probable F420-dependent enzyme
MMTTRFGDAASEDSVMPLRLSAEEIDELLDRRLIAKLATVNPDGSVHLVAMWFRRDGNRILCPTSHHTRKARNLRERPAATLMVDSSREGLQLRGVIIRGAAELIEGEEARTLNRSIHLRYLSERAFDLPAVSAYLCQGDDVTVAVRMERVSSWNLADGEAGRAVAEAGAGLSLDL